MAEQPSSRDPASGWVLAGSEGLPIETVGAELDLGGAELELASCTAEEEEEEEEEGTRSTSTAATDNGSAAFPGVKPGTGCLQHAEEPRDTGAVPDTAEPDVPDTREPEEPDSALGPCPDTPKAGSHVEGESGSSSDEDTAGLGQEPQPGPPSSVPAPPRGTPNPGTEDGLSVSKFLLGALALAAVGLLLVTGGLYDLVDGPVESVVTRDVEQEPPLPTEGNDSWQKPPSPDAGDAQSVNSVSILLDRLAQGSQEIRLMQAELQAHKAELQELLRRSEDEAAAAGAQRQSLAAENARLRAALEWEEAALRNARAELQRLRESGAPGSSGFGGSAPKEPPSSGTPGRRDDAAAQRERGRLAWVQQELAGALERSRGAGGLEGLAEELSALAQRLSRELEAEGAGSFPKAWKKPFQVEKKRHERHERHGDGASHHDGASHREWERKEHPKSHGKGSREHKASKKAPHGPPFSRYRAPQGCSGVADCARKEGREVLGVALEPVQKTQFLKLLEEFLGRLGWGQHFGGLAARLAGAFGSDGAFAHDRLRFVDFVEDVEELLEEVAKRERGDEEAADGFEEFVLQHYRGPAGKERGRRARPPGTGG
ncbi:pre-B-cell leukemia transcription factor-interacting protein 1 [Phaenicophaeus curvirostris]|uniref:pre-B-cell leukemia transcription factor-interacting protein 1 n=1 Tax=Phaenicophaeus curvirostris TaxID=33595 RepID=UPI0037F0BB90